MSVNLVFLLSGVAMTLLAIAWVAVPIWRARGGEGAPAGRGMPVTAGSVAVVVAALGLAGLVSYPGLSNFDWSTLDASRAAARGGAGARAPGGGAGPEMATAPAPDAVNALAQRLRQQGGSLDEWRLLGRSYIGLERYGAAEQAFREAYRQSTGDGAELAAQVAAEYAEAMILADERALLAEAAPLLESSLSVLPDNPRALWWGGLSAFERGEYSVAATRWERMAGAAEVQAQPEMVQLLTSRATAARQLAAQGAPPPAELRARMAAEGAGQATVPPAAGAAPGGAAGAGERGGLANAAPRMDDRTADPAAGTDGGAPAVIAVSVSVAPELAGEVPPGKTVFVIARRPGGGGPPLAVVRRRTGDLPLQVELSDADAMLPGRGISTADEVEVVARVSMSGNPIASPGDLWGSARVPVRDRQRLSITISEVTR